jgi:uncharacterized protein (TIGR02466 family)
MKKSKLNTEHWFPTPIWNYKFNTINTNQFNEAIKYCYEVKKNDPGRVLSNVGGWQSNALHYNYFINSPLALFFNEIIPLLNELAVEVASSRVLNFSDVWININKKGDKNLLHSHPNCLFSGVFYITDKNSKIKFVKNYDIFNWWKECMQSKSDTQSTFNEIEYTPHSGDLIIFPAWLQHYVDCHEYDSERISISFNIK